MKREKLKGLSLLGLEFGPSLQSAHTIWPGSEQEHNSKFMKQGS